MAFGARIGTLSGNGTSVTNPSNATGSVVVAEGDLIIAVMAEQTSLTVSGVTDNLGNTYTAQNAGTNSGNITGRMFYSKVNKPGTLTTVSFAATASADNFSVGAVCYTGDFRSSPIDKNLANVSNDITTPYAATATGTLTQATELIIGWAAKNNSAIWAASSPGTADLNVTDSGALASLCIQSWVVAATTSVTPSFTGTAPAQDVLGSATFMAGDVLMGQAAL